MQAKKSYSKVPPNNRTISDNLTTGLGFSGLLTQKIVHISLSTRQKQKKVQVIFVFATFWKNYTHYFQEFKFQYFVENNEFFVGKSFRLAFRSLFNQYVYLFKKAHVMFSKNQKQKKGMSFSKNNMCFLSYLYFLRNPFFAGKV